jgi:hypothetical protein
MQRGRPDPLDLGTRLALNVGRPTRTNRSREPIDQGGADETLPNEGRIVPEGVEQLLEPAGILGAPLDAPQARRRAASEVTGLAHISSSAIDCPRAVPTLFLDDRARDGLLETAASHRSHERGKRARSPPGRGRGPSKVRSAAATPVASARDTRTADGKTDSLHGIPPELGASYAGSLA